MKKKAFDDYRKAIAWFKHWNGKDLTRETGRFGIFYPSDEPKRAKSLQFRQCLLRCFGFQVFTEL